MNIENVNNVSMYGGILKPNGIKYIPESLSEFNSINSKVRSYRFSGNSTQCGGFVDHSEVGVNDLKRGTRSNEMSNHYIEFTLDGTVYYIDMSTIYRDIRDSKLNELV